MPEEPIETQELKEHLEEAHEHAEHGGTPWLRLLSLSTAVLAVLAAIAALESGSHANDAILEKDDAILHQSKADDAWAYYQAKGVEAAVYASQADALSDPALVAKFRASAERERVARADLRREAEEEQKTVVALNEKAERSLHSHHEFAKSVTFSQVAIALSAIAALMRQKTMWWVSLGAGVLGAAFFGIGLSS